MTQSRKYILHSRHEWLGDSNIHWTQATRESRSNSFTITDVGDCLALKLGGFIDAQKAVIDAVSENEVLLHLGVSPLRSLLWGGGCPLDLHIQFRRTASDRTPQSRVDVTILDRRWRGDTSHFEEAARRVLLQLQHHMMVNHDALNLPVAWH